MNNISEKKKFSIIARARSVRNAVRGIGVILRTQHNIWIHIVGVVIGIWLGVHYRIAEGEWATLVLAMAALLAAEGFNTALEIDIDLTSPEYHPYARDTKDVAAGAVLLTGIGAIAVALIIFLPKIFG